MYITYIDREIVRVEEEVGTDRFIQHTSIVR